jgi:hypothetical protein
MKKPTQEELKKKLERILEEHFKGTGITWEINEGEYFEREVFTIQIIKGDCRKWFDVSLEELHLTNIRPRLEDKLREGRKILAELTWEDANWLELLCENLEAEYNRRIALEVTRPILGLAIKVRIPPEQKTPCSVININREKESLPACLGDISAQRELEKKIIKDIDQQFESQKRKIGF